MIWLLYEPFNIFFMLLCMLTNPIVVLFSNEEGELPGIFRYWQTWDDSLNPRFYILNHVPKALKYDYDKHYEEYWDTSKYLKKLNCKRCFARVKDPHFTFKEKVQRYICRVMWLYRNCSYGFAFYTLGRMCDGSKFKKKIYKDYPGGLYSRFIYDDTKSILTRPWSFKCTKKICSWLRWEIFIGWKAQANDTGKSQKMIAHRIAFRLLKKK